MQAIKVATLLAALDWADDESAAQHPVVRASHWYRAQQIVETWRASAHRLLADLGENEEARLENRILGLLRAHPEGASPREIYRTLRSSRKPVTEALRALENDNLVVRVTVPGKPGPRADCYRLTDI